MSTGSRSRRVLPELFDDEQFQLVTVLIGSGSGSISGTSTVLGVSASTVAAVGAISGGSTVSGVGSITPSTGHEIAFRSGRFSYELFDDSFFYPPLLTQGSGVGSISGSSTVLGVSSIAFMATGSIIGGSTVLGVAGLPGAVGSISGSSTVTGVLIASVQAVGTIIGTSSVSGVVSNTTITPPNAYTGITRGELRDRIREQLINSFWTDAELNTYIEEALRMWGILTGYYRRRTSHTFASNQTDYDVSGISADCLSVQRIDLISSHLDPIGIEELGQFNPTWQQDMAASPINWVPLGLNKIILYPKPSIPVSTIVDYLYFTPMPTSDNDYIQVGAEDIDALIDYVQFLAALKEGGAELKDNMPQLQNFLKQTAIYNSKLLKSSIFRRILGAPAGGQRNTRPKVHEGLPRGQ